MHSPPSTWNPSSHTLYLGSYHDLRVTQMEPLVGTFTLASRAFPAPSPSNLILMTKDSYAFPRNASKTFLPPISATATSPVHFISHVGGRDQMHPFWKDLIK